MSGKTSTGIRVNAVAPRMTITSAPTMIMYGLRSEKLGTMQTPNPRLSAPVDFYVDHNRPRKLARVLANHESKVCLERVLARRARGEQFVPSYYHPYGRDPESEPR